MVLERGAAPHAGYAANSVPGVRPSGQPLAVQICSGQICLLLGQKKVPQGHPKSALILRVTAQHRGRPKARPYASVAARHRAAPLRANPVPGGDARGRSNGAKTYSAYDGGCYTKPENALIVRLPPAKHQTPAVERLDGSAELAIFPVEPIPNPVDIRLGRPVQAKPLDLQRDHFKAR